MNLAEMAAEVEQVNRDSGWYDGDRTFGDLIALLHSEVSEAFEAYRTYETYDATGVTGKGVWVNGVWHGAPAGVGSEFADVLIRLLDACSRHGIDLEAEYHRKVAFNRIRPYRHGGKKL